MKKAGLIVDIIFIVVAVLTLAELAFVRGMFTGIFSLIAITVIGAVDAIMLLIRKEYHKSVLTSLLSIAIITGYTFFL